MIPVSTVLEICVSVPEQPFVCGAWGWITKEAIEEIERQLSEEPLDVAPEMESVKVEATWVAEDCGYSNLGHGYWDFDVLEATPQSETTSHGNPKSGNQASCPTAPTAE